MTITRPLEMLRDGKTRSQISSSSASLRVLVKLSRVTQAESVPPPATIRY